jgi:hypothetical protein
MPISHITDREDQAHQMAACRGLLVLRLRRALRRLDPHLRATFTGGSFEFEKQRLLDKEGFFCLQWKLRADPCAPISRKNRQSRAGMVEFMATERSDTFWDGRR